MARPINKLDDKQLKAWVSQAKKGELTKRFMKGDGGGLWFHLAPPHGASWLFRYAVDGKERFMGLGNGKGYPDLSLARARELAAEQRRLLVERVDPLKARQEEQATRLLERHSVKTFKECALAYIKTHDPSWRNRTHAAQWPSNFEKWAYPIFGDLSVADIDTKLVLAVLRQDVTEDGKVIGPLWDARGETARKLRQRMGRVFDWARAAGYRKGDNPADLKGNLEPLLGKQSKIKRNHAWLAHKDMPEFMADLRKREALSALALEFVILTAARTGEVTGARWGEFDLEEGLWTIPAERMKAGKQHRVPLSDAALAVLEKVKPLAKVKAGKPDPAALIFPGQGGQPLSGEAMRTLVKRRMGRSGFTIHGFRGSFSTWARETTSFPRDLVEMSLAHSADKVEAAYQHSDMLERRRDLMNAWAKVCAGPAGGNVRALREVAA